MISARLRAMLLPMLGFCLTGCVSAPPQTRPVIAAKSVDATVSRALIRRELVRLCPPALASTTLVWVADNLDRDPARGFGPAADIDRLDRQTRVCRGD